MFVSSVIAAVGLTLFAHATGVIVFIAAATIYGIGKTFFWPTMLAVVSERFPRGGALTIGMVGGVGALSGGFLGTPGIGFNQDYYAVKDLKSNSQTAAVYHRFEENKPKRFLAFELKGLDVQKTNLLQLYHDIETTQDTKKKEELQSEFASRLKHNPELASWWNSEAAYAKHDLKPIDEAKIYGGQMAFQVTAIVPAVMALLYLLLILYFRMKGGYKRLAVDSPATVAAGRRIMIRRQRILQTRQGMTPGEPSSVRSRSPVPNPAPYGARLAKDRNAVTCRTERRLELSNIVGLSALAVPTKRWCLPTSTKSG